MRIFLCLILLSSVYSGHYCTSIYKDESPPLFRYDYTFNTDTQGWFKLHKIPALWREANNRCKYEGADLATPTDNIILNAMKRILSEENIFDAHIGIHSNFSYGDYYTTKGIPLNLLPVTWGLDRPSTDRDERCVVLQRIGTIKNANCAEVTLPYICYKTRKNDTLGKCGTYDKEYIYSENTGSCYKFHPIGETWSTAFMICSAEGGHLAVINNIKEKDFLKEMFENYPSKAITSEDAGYAFVGLIDIEHSGRWVTIHDELLQDSGYSTWAEGQPSHNQNDEFCGSIARSAGLNDAPCQRLLAFICEKKPDSLLMSNEFSQFGQADKFVLR